MDPVKHTYTVTHESLSSLRFAHFLLTQDQRRKMKTTTLSSVHIYSQLEPCYAHYSALEGIAAEKKVSI